MLEATIIGGVRFLPVTDGTMEHDLHYMQLYTKAGLKDLAMKDGESPEDFAQRILGELLSAGVVLEMLGTLLVPEGKDPEKWTPAMAKETATLIGAMRDPDAKKQMQGCVAMLVMDFFERGLVSFWKNSQSSIGEPSPQTNGQDHADTPGTPTEIGVT